MEIIQRKRERAVVKRIPLNTYRRIIVTSDIHGDHTGFIRMLEQVDFSEHDAVVILGDILEKGADSLGLLRTVISHAKAGNLYAVEGNNDAIFINWYAGNISDEDICRYVNSRKSSFILDMARQLGMRYETAEDIKRLKAALEGSFHEEIEFLKGLPHIIESELAVFVHAGIQPGELEDQDPEYCMTAEEFGHQQYHFEKTVIVGHWPTSNYSSSVITINPYINKASNVISIDGGNSMKRWQQINYLIFQNGTIQFGYYDNLPQIRALDSQEESTDPFSLLFPRTQIESIRETDAGKYCYFPYLKRELLIAEEHIYRHKGRYYSHDFTTYRLPVNAGELLSYCDDRNNGILVKRNGIVGNYYGRYEFTDM